METLPENGGSLGAQVSGFKQTIPVLLAWVFYQDKILSKIKIDDGNKTLLENVPEKYRAKAIIEIISPSVEEVLYPTPTVYFEQRSSINDYIRELPESKAQTLAPTYHRRHNIVWVKDSREQKPTLHYTQLYNADDIIRDFLAADNSKILSLFDSFYTKAVSSGPTRINEFKTVASEYIDCGIDMNSEVPHDKIASKYGHLKLTEDMLFFIKANYHRLIGLPAIMATHMLYRPQHIGNITVMHDYIINGLFENELKAREVTICNLVKTSRLSNFQDRNEIVFERGQHLLQQKNGFEAVIQLCEGLMDGTTSVTHNHLLANYLLNNLSLGIKTGDDELQKKAEIGLSKIVSTKHPLMPKYVDMFKSEIGRLGHLETAHMTELVANATEAEEGGLHPELIFMACLSYCDYFLETIDRLKGFSKSVVIDKWTAHVSDTRMYDAVLSRGIKQFGFHLKDIPGKLNRFVTEELRDMLIAHENPFSSSKESIDAMKRIRFFREQSAS